MGRQNPGKRQYSLTGQEAVMGLSSGKYWTIQQGQKVVEFVMVQLNCLTKLHTMVLSFQFTQVKMTPQQKHTYGKK